MSGRRLIMRQKRGEVLTQKELELLDTYRRRERERQRALRHKRSLKSIDAKQDADSRMSVMDIASILQDMPFEGSRLRREQHENELRQNEMRQSADAQAEVLDPYNLEHRRLLQSYKVELDALRSDKLIGPGDQGEREVELRRKFSSLLAENSEGYQAAIASGPDASKELADRHACLVEEYSTKLGTIEADAAELRSKSDRFCDVEAKPNDNQAWDKGKANDEIMAALVANAYRAPTTNGKGESVVAPEPDKKTEARAAVRPAVPASPERTGALSRAVKNEEGADDRRTAAADGEPLVPYTVLVPKSKINAFYYVYCTFMALHHRGPFQLESI